MNIAEKEALALQLCIMNLSEPHQLAHVRVHVDNQNVIHAFQNDGCRNLYVHNIVLWLWEWQQKHNCKISLVYVNTLNNLSDEPSRILDIDDETRASPFLIQVSIRILGLHIL